MARPPSTVGVATARHADIPVIIEALGTVTSGASVTVTPQVSGVITQVLYTEGQMVKKGQLLATIDPKPFEAAVAQAAAARLRDRAQLDSARVQLERYQVLLKQDSIARQTVDTQDALVKQLAGTVALDRANEDTARLNLQWSRIVAPVAGSRRAAADRRRQLHRVGCSAPASRRSRRFRRSTCSSRFRRTASPRSRNASTPARRCP